METDQTHEPWNLAKSPHVSTRQYARIVPQWVAAIGLDSTVYGTHGMRRTKATLIYKRTKNLKGTSNNSGQIRLVIKKARIKARIARNSWLLRRFATQSRDFLAPRWLIVNC